MQLNTSMSQSYSSSYSVHHVYDVLGAAQHHKGIKLHNTGASALAAGETLQGPGAVCLQLVASVQGCLRQTVPGEKSDLLLVISLFMCRKLAMHAQLHKQSAIQMAGCCSFLVQRRQR